MPAALPSGSTVAVIGAGAMGAGIAQIAALNGHDVQLHDTRLGAGDAAKKGIAETLCKLVAKGRLAQIDVDAEGQICALTMEHASQRADVPSFSFEQIAA